MIENIDWLTNKYRENFLIETISLNQNEYSKISDEVKNKTTTGDPVTNAINFKINGLGLVADRIFSDFLNDLLRLRLQFKWDNLGDKIPSKQLKKIQFVCFHNNSGTIMSFGKNTRLKEDLSIGLKYLDLIDPAENDSRLCDSTKNVINFKTDCTIYGALREKNT